MKTDAPAPAGKAVPEPIFTPIDFTISRLTRQRDAAEQMMDKLYAQIAALERDKQELIKRVAELTAEQANPKTKKEASNG